MPYSKTLPDFNYNPLTCSLEAPYPLSDNEKDRIPPWFKQYRITLLDNVVDEDLRDSTGFQPKEYSVKAEYIDMECLACGGGVSAAAHNEQWVENQIGTFYVDWEPPITVQSAILFEDNIFVIEAVEPNSVHPAVWKIHGIRRRPNVEVLENLNLQILALTSASVQDHYTEKP